jgi:inhibitor of KinA
MKYKTDYCIFPLGDTAITVDFGNFIDEEININVLGWYQQLTKDPIKGTIEIVPAYSSLTIHYDMLSIARSIPKGKQVYAWMREQLEGRLQQSLNADQTDGSLVRIPVCYDIFFAPDLKSLAASKEMTIEEVVRIHQSKPYRVFMLGFLPGFAYLGQVADELAMPRKSKPVEVAAGSIGIAGHQTGIYPMVSPGGWHIIGRTPVSLFDSDKDNPTLIKPGDTVQFFSISLNEFENY